MKQTPEDLEQLAAYHKNAALAISSVVEADNKEAEEKKAKENLRKMQNAELNEHDEREREVRQKAIEEIVLAYKKSLVYSTKLARAMCARVAAGEMLTAICEDHTMPLIEMVIDWLNNNTDFSEAYLRATKIRNHVFEDQLIMIADNTKNDYMDKQGKGGETFRVLDNEAIARSKMRIDVRLRLLKASDPTKWGDNPNANAAMQETLRNMRPNINFTFVEAPASFAQGDDARVINHHPVETIASRTNVLDQGDLDYVKRRDAFLDKLEKVKVA